MHNIPTSFKVYRLSTSQTASFTSSQHYFSFSIRNRVSVSPIPSSFTSTYIYFFTTYYYYYFFTYYSVFVSRVTSPFTFPHVSLCFSINFWIFSILPLPAPTHTHIWHTCAETCVLKCCHCLTICNSHTHTHWTLMHERACEGNIIFIFSRLLLWINNNCEFAFSQGQTVISIFTWLIGFIFNLNQTKGKLITVCLTRSPHSLSVNIMS